VHVEKVVTELNWSAVSAAIDGHPYFSRDGPKLRESSGSAWHAVKVHNHCRPMGSPEACCERVGSLMQHRWTKRGGQDASNLMDSVLLHDAQVMCIGTERDDMLCGEIAHLMLHIGRSPFVTDKAAKRRRLQEGVDTSRSLMTLRSDANANLAKSGRLFYDPAHTSESGTESSEASGLELARAGRGGSSGTTAQVARSLNIDRPHQIAKARTDRRGEALPAMVLPPRVSHALTRSTVDGGVAALPIFQEDVRTSGKQRAGSVLRENLAAWLDTEEGRRWQAAKKKTTRGNGHVSLRVCAPTPAVALVATRRITALSCSGPCRPISAVPAVAITTLVALLLHVRTALHNGLGPDLVSLVSTSGSVARALSEPVATRGLAPGKFWPHFMPGACLAAVWPISALAAVALTALVSLLVYVRTALRRTRRLCAGQDGLGPDWVTLVSTSGSAARTLSEPVATRGLCRENFGHI
jgi:hypothetical protein